VSLPWMASSPTRGLAWMRPVSQEEMQGWRMGKVAAVSAAEARRLALAAQGLGRPRPARVNLGHLRRLVERLGAVQIDAVNVLVRSHYLTAYSRLGPYPLDLFDRLAYERLLAFEYWGHAASFLPVDFHPVLRWRMAEHADGKYWRALEARLRKERPGYLEAVEQEIADRGPLTFTDLSDPGRREKVSTKYAESTLLWWRWSDGKAVLEALFDAGRVAVAGRSRGFERLYDLTDRVIPEDVLESPAPGTEEAQRRLVRHAAGALGVATVRDLADYFRLPIRATRARVRELVDAGDLEPAEVEGWEEDAYLDPKAKAAPVDARALLSPFDSLLWERARTKRLFGFEHSFELYVPRKKRRYGYYVLPFLLGERLVARVDLKADRAAGALLVLAAHREDQMPARQVAGELAEALRDMASWLDLGRIEVSDAGDLAGALRRAKP
jgi:uncharacterized protein